jgi:hypothetical protein
MNHGGCLQLASAMQSIPIRTFILFNTMTISDRGGDNYPVVKGISPRRQQYVACAIRREISKLPLISLILGISEAVCMNIDARLSYASTSTYRLWPVKRIELIRSRNAR